MSTQLQVSWAEFAVPEPLPMEKGCPPGSWWFHPPDVPPLAAAARCTTCPPHGAGPLPERAGDDDDHAQLYRLRSGICRPVVNAFAPPPLAPVYESGALD